MHDRSIRQCVGAPRRDTLRVRHLVLAVCIDLSRGWFPTNPVGAEIASECFQVPLVIRVVFNGVKRSRAACRCANARVQPDIPCVADESVSVNTADVTCCWQLTNASCSDAGFMKSKPDPSSECYTMCYNCAPCCSDFCFVFLRYYCVLANRHRHSSLTSK